MANINEVYGGNYLKATDIPQPYEVTIESVGTVEMEDKDTGKVRTKLVIQFAEFGEKKLVCNATNAKLIAAQHGPETDNWQGKTVILAVEDVTFGSDIVPAIRVKRPAQAPVKPQPTARAAVKPQAKPVAIQAQGPDDAPF